MTPTTDEYGRLTALGCHDGHLLAVEIFDDRIELKLRRFDRTPVRVVLRDVCRFATNQFLEGNIVDTTYAWDLANVPANLRKAAAAAFSLDESCFDRAKAQNFEWLFVLESSYGATVHAIVKGVEIE